MEFYVDMLQKNPITSKYESTTKYNILFLLIIKIYNYNSY